MTNQLQICNWLVNHPNILQMATQMLNMKDGASSTPAVPAALEYALINNVSF